MVASVAIWVLLLSLLGITIIREKMWLRIERELLEELDSLEREIAALKRVDKG